MSIRVFVRGLQSLSADYNDADAASNMDFRLHGTHLGAPTRVLTVGMYEIKGTDKIMVTNVLLSRILDKIKAVLAGLKHRSEIARRKMQRKNAAIKSSSRSVPEDEGGVAEYEEAESDFNHLQQLLRGLENTVQFLLKELKSSNTIRGQSPLAVRQL